ncbi:MAG: response regulator [Desulfonatronovibrio sp.]
MSVFSEQNKIKNPETMTKVLVIDDEPSALKLFSMFLKAYGYKSFEAESGEEGLDIFKSENPEIVFTDIKMPGIDGLEVLRRIKSMVPRTEVVVITGHGDMDLAIRALNSDATDFINKPIKREELEKALNRASQRLGQIRSRKESVELGKISKGKADIKFHGNIDAFSEPYIWEAYNKCLHQKCQIITLMFKDNVSINGAGMNALTEVINNAASNKVRIEVSGLSSNLLKIFRELKLIEKINILSS